MTSSPDKREHLYKILVIGKLLEMLPVWPSLIDFCSGELGTGKTSFIKRYVHQFFSQNYRATIGVDFALKVLNWDQSTIIRLQLWDVSLLKIRRLLCVILFFYVFRSLVRRDSVT
jgi:Ras-related protein Rab-32